MILTRFYDDSLAQASFLIGCSASGEAVIIDPNRRVEQYIAAADQAGLRISAVTETHIHADFVSGARELVSRTGATLYLSDEGGADWQYRYATDAGAVPLTDGSSIEVGRVRLVAMHTPGHTPEHLSFLVTDTAGADGPIGIVTGDFVFAGDVGRPDLLERAAGVANAADAGARVLFRSLQRFRTLAEHLQVWPGHGAGSACGKGMSSMPQTTVGYELRYNWALQIADEAEFVRQALIGLPEPPRYFGEMKRINRDGPPLLGDQRSPSLLPEQRLKPLLAAGAMVVDLRGAAAFAAGHVPGTISIPFNKSFTTWAGSLIPFDREFYLIADERGRAVLDHAAQDLMMIGLSRLAGAFGPEVLETWTAQEGPLQTAAQLSVAELSDRLQRNEVMVLDVRSQAEWDAGHLAGASHIPLGSLPERLTDIPVDRPLVVHCQGGGRSAIGVSLLQAAGHRAVANLSAGFGGWQGAGLPIVPGRPGSDD
ncbi:MAG: rhodanese-like domain-containing protein [Gemmatimonadota bacterium]